MRHSKRAVSIPAPSTENQLYSAENECNFANVFVNYSKSDKLATRMSDEKVYPYRPARLIIPKKSSKDQRWLIRWYPWDKDKGRIIGISEYGLNVIPDLKERRRYAAGRVRELNEKMRTPGFCVFQSKTKKLAEQQKATEQAHLKPASESLLMALENKKGRLRPRTYTTYLNILKQLSGWLSSHGYERYPAHNITKEILEQYLDYVLTGKSKRTYNNHLLTIKILFGYLKLKPFTEIQRLKAPIGKNIGFTPEQIKAQIDYMKEYYPNVLFASLFMYQTMFRTNEMAHLRVGDIGRYNPEQIYLSDQFAKTGVEQNVDIHPQLMDTLKQIKLSCPEDWYLFGSGFKPSPTPCNSKSLGQYYSHHILKPLNIPNPPYTFYSWRHTSAIHYWGTTGANMADLMKIGRWTNPTTPGKYLKTLGLRETKSNIENKPYLPV